MANMSSPAQSPRKQWRRGGHGDQRNGLGQFKWIEGSVDDHVGLIPDGSTKFLFVQLTDFNGFAVIDFASHEEIKRIRTRICRQGKEEVPQGRDPSHGMAVTPDGKLLLVTAG